MASFDALKVGDVLYDCKMQKMGNVNMSRMAWWTVKIVSIDTETRSAMCSWNGNAPKRWHERKIKSLRRSPPKSR